MSFRSEGSRPFSGRCSTLHNLPKKNTRYSKPHPLCPFCILSLSQGILRCRVESYRDKGQYLSRGVSRRVEGVDSSEAPETRRRGIEGSTISTPYPVPGRTRKTRSLSSHVRGTLPGTSRFPTGRTVRRVGWNVRHPGPQSYTLFDPTLQEGRYPGPVGSPQTRTRLRRGHWNSQHPVGQGPDTKGLTQGVHDPEC